MRHWATIALLLAAAGACAAGPWDDHRSARAESAKIQGWIHAKNEAALGDYFEAWASAHGRKYSGNERSARYGHWKREMENIASINLNTALTWTAAPNEFTDWTDEEKARHSAAYVPAGALEAAAASEGAPTHGRRLQATYPTTLDWQTAGKVTPVKNQGSCGSCWAFAATAGVEAKMLMLYNKVVDLSEQQLNDCSDPDGCGGGSSPNALSYIYNNFQTMESRYPYAGKNQVCRTDVLNATAPDEKVTLKPTGSKQLSYNNVTAMIDALQTHPIINYYYVNTSNFYSYKSGVYNGPCDTSSINHAVLIVGYDITAGVGQPGSYFRVKNSWGTGFGESGYFRIAMSAAGYGTCAMNQWNWEVSDVNAPAPAGTCTDGIRNHEEGGVDCGGPYCPACTCTNCPSTGCKTCNTVDGTCSVNKASGTTCSANGKTGTCNGSGTCNLTCPTCSECTSCDTTTGTCTKFLSSTTACTNGMCDGAGTCLVNCGGACTGACEVCNTATNTCELKQQGATCPGGTCSGTSSSCVMTCTNCSGPCKSCNTSTGVCSNLDTTHECGVGGFCDGNGSCTLTCPPCDECYECDPSTGSCVASSNTASCRGGAGKCNGAGTCLLTCPDNCTGLCKSCDTSTGLCTINKDSGALCTGGTCNGAGQCLLDCGTCPACQSCNTSTGQCMVDLALSGTTCSMNGRTGTCDAAGSCLLTCPTCSECYTCDTTTGTCKPMAQGDACNGGTCNGSGKCLKTCPNNCAGLCKGCDTSTGLCSINLSSGAACSGGPLGGTCNGTGTCLLKCATCPDCKSCDQTTGYCTANKASGSTCTGGTCNATGTCVKYCTNVVCPDCYVCNTTSGLCNIKAAKGALCSTGKCTSTGTCQACITKRCI